MVKITTSHGPGSVGTEQGIHLTHTPTWATGTVGLGAKL